MTSTRRGFLGYGVAGIACGLGAIIGLPALRGKPTTTPARYRVTTDDLRVAGLHQHQLGRFIEKTGGVLEFEWTLEEQLKRIKGPLSCHFFFMMNQHIVPTWNMAGADLSGARLIHVNWPGIDLRGSNLEGANLQDAQLQGAQLQGSNLKDANLENAALHGAVLASSNLARANLRGADLGCALLQYANLQEADMLTASLRGANLVGADLRNARLAGWRVLEASRLSFTNLQGCRLFEEEAAEARERGAIL